MSTNKRIIAIHQPNYLPWLGYFFKIFASDVFVFLDDVQYTKKSLIKRTYIRKAKNSKEKRYLIVPLKKHSDFAGINELFIDHDQNWQRAQLNQIFNSYSHSPFFENTISLLEHWFQESKSYNRLADLNIFMVQQFCRLLRIETAQAFSSQMSLGDAKGDYNIRLTGHFAGDIYLSGTGAHKYQQETEYHKAGLELWYSDFYSFLQQHPYPQLQGEFLNGLSILDALFNIGPEGIISLFKHYYALLQSEYFAADSSPGLEV